MFGVFAFGEPYFGDALVEVITPPPPGPSGGGVGGGGTSVRGRRTVRLPRYENTPPKFTNERPDETPRNFILEDATAEDEIEIAEMVTAWLSVLNR